jgi:hypothetical protein
MLGKIHVKGQDGGMETHLRNHRQITLGADRRAYHLAGYRSHQACRTLIAIGSWWTLGSSQRCSTLQLDELRLSVSIFTPLISYLVLHKAHWHEKDFGGTGPLQLSYRDFNNTLGPSFNTNGP